MWLLETSSLLPLNNMAQCPEKSIACRVKVLELNQIADSHPPAVITYGGPAFSWDVLTQSGTIPIFQTWPLEVVPPGVALAAADGLLYVHHAPTGLLLLGIRINSATPGSAGLSVQLYAGSVEMLAAPLLLTGGTQYIPVEDIVEAKRSLLAGEKLEVEVIDEPPGYGTWEGLSIDYIGFVDLNALSAGEAPFNLLAPVISGFTVAGSLILSVVGAWSGNPSVYSYQWFVNGVAVSGATGPNYTIQSEDAGLSIRVRVTATNEFGSTTAFSNYITAFDPDGPPVNSTTPSISGSNVVDGVLAANVGAWTGSPTSYTYQWYLDGGAISGETSSTYTVLAGDEGHSIRVGVIASNLYGSSSEAQSNAVIISGGGGGGDSDLVYWGRNADGVLDEAQVVALADSLLTANPAGNYPIIAGAGYWYIALPVSLAPPTGILVTASSTPLALATTPDFPEYDGVIDTLTYMPLTIDGSAYYIFRSYNTLAAAGGITVTT